MALLESKGEGGASSYLFQAEGTSLRPHHLDCASAGCTSCAPVLMHSRARRQSPAAFALRFH